MLFRVLDAVERAQTIEGELRLCGTPKRAVGEKQYLKSDLTFLGATLGDIRRVTRAESKELDRDDTLRLVEELWSAPIFERRMAAVLILEHNAEALGTGDLELLERLIRESHTWALVDILAGNVVGELALHHRMRRVLDRWSRDDDFWVRRSSLLAEMRRLKQGADFEPFARRADAMLDEREFFIRKAIGWVLRETSKTRADEVYSWIAPRTDRASGVTMRECIKYLGSERTDRLMKAYRERRPTEPARV